VDDKEFVLIEPRARRVPTVMYLGGIVVKGTEHTATPQFVIYGAHPSILKDLVNSHNELLRIKKEQKEKEKV